MPRLYRLLLFFLLALLLNLPPSSHAQTPNVVRIQPATLPIPLPPSASRPIPPDRLRTESPWTLSMAGGWRFQLTHGEIIDGRFALSAAELTGVRASSSENGHSPDQAFDTNADTRWSANNGDFPQWIQARLDKSRPIIGVGITWERPNAHYICRVDGSDDAAHWQPLTAATPSPGIGDGTVVVPASAPAVRFVRVVVLGADGGSWASIRELHIHYRDDGADVAWHPAMASNAPAPHPDDFAAVDLDDHAWDKIVVPSNWEMAGYSIPTYNAVDDTVGLYRRTVEVPATWVDRHIVWRFDGALDGAEIYVNGQRVGYHESGYTAFDVDLTGFVRPGAANVFAVRVCKTTPSVDSETGDYQCMGGIYRDTQLIAVPATHIEDITVQTTLIHSYRDADFQALVPITGTPGEKLKVVGSLTDATTGVRVPVNLSAPELTVGADGTASAKLTAPVASPRLWSAEKPALYYLTIELDSAAQSAQPVERVEQRFGFRQVEIKNDVVLWNGKPIKCTGICRHDFWADKGFALTDNEWRKDLTMMKATNINAIRTSHYNHAARFLELCDEYGFYILDEVPFCWVGDKVKDPAFAAPLLQRAAETVARDKNRACVLAWSLGNENPVGPDTQQVHDLVARLDPTRPSFASGSTPRDVVGQQMSDTHYPGPDSVDRYAAETVLGVPEVITEHPHTFYSKATQDYDPGASDTWSEGLIATWDKLYRAPNLLGAFIWEWQNQGIADKNPDRTSDFWYGPDHMRQENNKGIVDAYRNPKAELWIVKMVYSPVGIAAKTTQVSGGDCIVPLINRFAFTDLGELTIHWATFRGDHMLTHGSSHIPGAPGATVDARFPVPADMTSLRLIIDRRDGSNITVANLPVSTEPTQAAPVALSSTTALMVTDAADSLRVENTLQQIAFDHRTGALLRWTVAGRPRLIAGAGGLNLGEAKTARGDHYYRASHPVLTDTASITALPVVDGSLHVVVKSHVRAETGAADLGVLTTTYDIRPSAEINVHWSLDWTAPEVSLWEIGLTLTIPSGIDREHWSRDAYFTSYPDGHIGAPTGAAGPNDVTYRSSKRNLHFLTLTDAHNNGLALLALDSPLIGRVMPGTAGPILSATRELAAAGPDDLSFSWFHAHDIHAKPGTPLTGSFTVRAIGPP